MHAKLHNDRLNNMLKNSTANSAGENSPDTSGSKRVKGIARPVLNKLRTQSSAKQLSAEKTEEQTTSMNDDS